MTTFVRLGFFFGATPPHPSHPVHSYPHPHPHTFLPSPQPHTPQTSLYLQTLKKQKLKNRNWIFNDI